MALGALLALDKYTIGKAVGEFNAVHESIGAVYAGMAKWSNEKGGGYFTPAAAEAAASYIRMHIRTGGEKLGGFAPTSSAWQEYKDQGAGTFHRTPFMFTGALHDSVGVIRRREGALRRSVVGINRNISVPKIGFAGVKGTG